MSEPEFLDRDDVRRAITRVYNGRVWDEALPAVLALQTAGIQTVVLKSLPQLQELYGDRGARLSHDVDVLVPGHDAHRAIETLQSRGWRHMFEQEYLSLVRVAGAEAAACQRSWHLIHPAPGSRAISIDLHSDTMPAWHDPPLDAGVWERTISVPFDGVDLYALSPEDRLIYLCWHFVADGMPPRKLADIQHVLDHGDDLDWQYLNRRADATGMTLVVRLVCDRATRHQTMYLPQQLVSPRARLRFRVLTWIGSRVKEQMGQRTTIAFRSLVHDRASVCLQALREIFLPDPWYLASHGYNPSQGGEPYLWLVARLHLRRILHRS